MASPPFQGTVLHCNLHLNVSNSVCDGVSVCVLDSAQPGAEAESQPVQFPAVGGVKEHFLLLPPCPWISDTCLRYPCPASKRNLAWLGIP